MNRRASVLMILFVGVSLPMLHAQSPEDILLSHDPHDSTLAADLRIEAALEHGGHRLVVWGTQVADGDAVVGALVMNLDGVQKIMTSAEARPFGAVDIVPMGEEDFLVVWNDRRTGGSGIYGSTIRSGSGLPDDELWLDSTGWFVGDVSYRSLGFGLQLFISRIDGADRSARMIDVDDASGGSPGASIPVADTVMAPHGSFPLTAEHYVMMLANGDAVIIDADGSIDIDPIPDDRMRCPHWIDEDGGIAVYRNDTLMHYPSISASLPDSVRYYPAGIHAFSAIHRDMTGWYLIAHIYRSEQEGYSIKRIRSYFSFTDTGTLHRDTVTLTGVYVPRSASICGSTFTTEVLYRRRNLVDIVVDLSICYDPNGSTTTRTTGTKASYYLGDSVAHATAVLPVTRRLSEYATSNVRVDWVRTPPQRLEYSTPIAPKTIVVGHLYPTVHASERFHVGWFTNDGRIGSTTILDVAGPLRLHNFLVLPPGTSPVFFSGNSVLSSRPCLITQSSSSTTFEQGYNHYVTSTKFSQSCYLPVDSIGIATFKPGGYQHASDRGGVTPTYHPPQLNPSRNEITGMTTFTHNPLTSLNPPRQTFYTFGREKSDTIISWSMDRTSPVLGFVPIDAVSVFVLGHHDTLTRYPAPQPLGQRIAMRRIDASSGERTILLQRLYGERLLRVTGVDSTDGRTLEVYGFDGRLLGERTLHGIGGTSSVAVAENPIDSSIVLVVGDAEGVTAITLGKELQIAMMPNGQPLGARYISSSNDAATGVACAIDAEGRLFAVWERMREGVSTIVGNWWQIPDDLDFPGTVSEPSDPTEPSEPFDPSDPAVSIPFTPGPSVLIRRTAPNPLYTSTTLHIQSVRNQNGRIALINARGEVVFTQELEIFEGTHLYPLDLSRLESGAYTLQIVGQEGRDDMNVIVVGE